MRIIDDEGRQREEIEKQMEEFKNRLKTISADYGENEDITWYILYRKRAILELQAIIYSITDDFSCSFNSTAIGSEVQCMIDKLDEKLSTLDSSIEDLYKELLDYKLYKEFEEELNL